jgi:hypothetical protein
MHTVSETVKLYSIRRLTAGEDFTAFVRSESSNSYTLPQANHPDKGNLGAYSEASEKNLLIKDGDA